MELQYLIDKNKGYQGNVLSTVYQHSDGFRRVAYTSVDHYEQGTRIIDAPDMTVEEYAHKNNIEPLVLDWDELYKLIEGHHNEQYLNKPWSKCSEDHFNEMRDCLPPMKWTYFEDGSSFFFICEATTADIHTAFIQHNGGYYTANRSRFQKPRDLLNQLLAQLQSN